MGFVCCQPWQRSAWPHHCPHAPAGSSYSSREGSLLCCCPFCACSTEFKCHQCDTVWGRTQTSLESLTSAHRGKKNKKSKTDSQKQQPQSAWDITMSGSPSWLVGWGFSCHHRLLDAKSSRRSSQVIPHLTGK